MYVIKCVSETLSPNKQKVYASDAWIDEKKTKIGYKIPFTREFYKYVAPRKSKEIFASHQSLDTQEQELMDKIIGR